MKNKFILCLIIILTATSVIASEAFNYQDKLSDVLKVATFDVDATPPIGYMMAYDECKGKWDLGLRAKGIVILGAGQPVVLLSVDWIGIGNETHREFRRAIASAAGTIPERVAVHTIHQHDAPAGDMKNDFILAVLHRIEMEIVKSFEKAQPVTHIGLGSSQVEKVASNRRLAGPDGKVFATRYTATADPVLRAEPEGLIDPMVSVISFWNEDKPVAVLSFYATHPQSYYRMGIANPDFPGVARFMRQLAVPDAMHIHFNGAGGNIGAGKYNDGSHENRLILAERLAAGMRKAYDGSTKTLIMASSVDWKTEPVSLPVDSIKDAALNSDFLKRFKISETIDIGCLSLGKARILFMPGELFVEYQLAAKNMRPDLFVAMAAYGDYSPGYIPTAEAFETGGYEVSVTRLLPSCETILMTAMNKLLKVKP